jgi:two-component system chemotaxis response regulator CheY
MKILIAEDDLTSRRFLSKFLSKYGECDIVIDGLEALDAFLISLKEKKLYDLICLDIMMPKVDGVKVLKNMKILEAQYNVPEEQRSKIIMTTAMTDAKVIHDSFDLGCDAYAAKPLDMDKFVEVLQKLKLIEKRP